MKIQPTPMAMSNRFKAQVIERRVNHPMFGKVVFETPWRPNMILDQGMDYFASNVLCNLFTHCAIGTGNTPTQDLSGAVTATTSGTTVTASGSIFAAGDVGKWIVFDSTHAAKIVTYTDVTHVEVSAALGVSSPTTFVKWRANQVGLTTETKRSNTYVTDYCLTTLAGNVMTHARGYDFTTEGADINYAEVGWSGSATATTNLNARALFAGGAVTVLAGQSLRVIYNFVLTITPSTPRNLTAPITGWPALQNSVTVDDAADTITFTGHGLSAQEPVTFGGTIAPGNITFGTTYYVSSPATNTFKVSATPGGAEIDILSAGTAVYCLTNCSGQECRQYIGLSSINPANGATASYDGVGQLHEPSTSGSTLMIALSPSTDAIQSFGGVSYATLATNLFRKQLSNSTYTNGNFYRDKTVTFIPSDSGSNRNDWRFICTINTSATNAQPGYVFRFNHPQQKSNTSTLTVTIRQSWTRTWN